MISRHIWVVLLMMFASCAFAQEEDNWTDNFLVFSSMDGEQVTRVDAEEAQILRATIIDSTVYYRDIKGYSISEDEKPYIRGAVLTCLNGGVPDSNTFVIKINNRDLGREDCDVDCGPTLFLYGQFNDGNLTRLYYVGVWQGSYAWKAVNSYLAIEREDGTPRVKLDAVLETIGFGLACYVRHPYNKEGVYDAIHHYMRIHAEFEVPEDVFKLLGKAAEPPVKLLEQDSSLQRQP